MPYSSESTSASHEASITFSETPIEPHTSLAVGGVEQHPGDRAGALGLVEDPDLEVDQVDVAQMRVDLDQRLAQRAVQRVDRAVALGGAHVALAVDPDLDRRLGLDAGRRRRFSTITRQDSSVNSGSYSPVSLAQQQLERAVGGLVVVAAVLELLDPLDDRAAAASSSSIPASRGARLNGALARQLGDQQLAAVADDLGLDVLERRRVGGRRRRRACPPLWANALRPT